MGRRVAIGIGIVLCAYLLLIFLGTAGCSTSGSGGGDRLRTESTER